MAKHSQSFGPSLALQDRIECTAATGAMSCASTIDVINCQEFWTCFLATCTDTAVGFQCLQFEQPTSASSPYRDPLAVFAPPLAPPIFQSFMLRTMVAGIGIFSIAGQAVSVGGVAFWDICTFAAVAVVLAGYLFLACAFGHYTKLAHALPWCNPCR